jgi:hypothetical protein
MSLARRSRGSGRRTTSPRTRARRQAPPWPASAGSRPTTRSVGQGPVRADFRRTRHLLSTEAESDPGWSLASWRRWGCARRCRANVDVVDCVGRSRLCRRRRRDDFSQGDRPTERSARMASPANMHSARRTDLRNPNRGAFQRSTRGDLSHHEASLGSRTARITAATVRSKPASACCSGTRST